MYRVEVYINNERLDLFDDESIVVNRSVQNIEDISRVFNDYSQDFTVPASPTNNKIFQHFYNFSITSGFDARVRHTAYIEVDAARFRAGSIRLNGAAIKNNKPEFYKLTFLGLLIELKDTIGDDYLSDLDLSSYDITYNSDNVKTGLVSGYSSGEFVFPLISTIRQWFYNSNVSSTTYEDRLANIAWNGSGTVHGFQWTSLRPALKVIKIIDAIETKYGITFSNDFWSTSDPIGSLFLWLASAESEEATKKKTRLTDYTSVTHSQSSLGSYDNSTGAYNPTTVGAPKIRNIIFQTDSIDGVAYTIQLMNGTQVMEEKSGTGNLKIDRDTPGGLTTGSSIYCRIVTTAAKTITLAKFEIDELSDDEVLNCQKSNISISGSTLQVVSFVPNIKILDFLGGLLKLFNCTVVPTSETAFTVKALDSWYEDGQIHDITEYVDFGQEIPVDRSQIYKEIVFKHEEPSTILADQFKKQNNVAYGDLETKLKNADGTQLDGEEYEIEVPFEQMVYEKLLDLNDNTETNVVYGLALSPDLGDTTPEPHLLFIIQRSVSANALSFVNDTTTKEQLNGNVYMPAHVESDTADYGITFGSDINEHDGGAITNSLFANYYQDYITDSFSIRRRKVGIKARLPVWLFTSLELNDRLIINGDRFLINDMRMNVTTGEVDFTLLNDIFGESTTFADESPIDDTSTTEEETGPPDTTPEPTTPDTAKSISISSSSAAMANTACNLTVNTIKYFAGSGNYPTLGDTIYNESAKTTVFNGGGSYYKITSGTSNFSIQINSSGIVIDIYDCDAGSYL